MNQSGSGDLMAKTALGFVAAGFIPFLLLADTLEALRNGWSPSLWLEWATLWVIVIWSSACLVLLVLPPTRLFLSRRSAELVVMHGMIALLLLGGQMLFSAISSRAADRLESNISIR